jgi:dihydrofolate reductase
MISIIAAVDKNFLIGNGDKLPWPNLPADMDFFKKMTKGKTVIMGSTTYWSLPEKFRPLSERENIVFSRKGNKIFTPSNGIWECNNLSSKIEDIIFSFSKDKEYLVIGGAEIYRLFLRNDWVDKVYLTRIDGEFEGDIYFPQEYLENASLTTISWQRADEKNNHGLHFVKYFIR